MDLNEEKGPAGKNSIDISLNEEQLKQIRLDIIDAKREMRQLVIQQQDRSRARLAIFECFAGSGRIMPEYIKEMKLVEDWVFSDKEQPKTRHWWSGNADQANILFGENFTKDWWYINGDYNTIGVKCKETGEVIYIVVGKEIPPELIKVVS